MWPPLLAAATAALFVPDPSCTVPPFEAVGGLNHMFRGANHGIVVRCADGNASLGLRDGAVELRCATGPTCLQLLTAYIADAEHPDPAAAIAAASAIVGVPSTVCNQTVDCGHPFAECVAAAAIPGAGYCKPTNGVTVGKSVCTAGLHASCDELVAGAVGGVVGFGLWWTVSRINTGLAARDSSVPSGDPAA